MNPNHQKYAKLLDSLGLEYHYKEYWVPYFDQISLRKLKKYVDFTVIKQDGSVEWIECKSANRLTPTAGRPELSKQADQAGIVYRGLNDLELRVLRQ